MAQTREQTTNGKAITRSSNGANNGSPTLHQQGYEIQKFGTVIDLQIALDAKARKESCELLNQVLADTIIIYNLYKKHHWLVRGATFYQLHLLLDKQANEQLELVDALAERVQKLGGIAIADPRHVAELTKITRPPNGAEEVPAMLSRLLDAHEIIIGEVREAIDKTEENKDMGTNDLFVSQVLRTNETHVWYLSEHLVDTPLVKA